MATPIASFDAQHGDLIHDCQFDYYSKKLATCSSDSTIKIFDVNGDVYHCSKTLTDHNGPVWQVAWAHPKFGAILASCSYDGTVKVHKETTPANWLRIYDYRFAEASVNSIAFAPHEFGLILACATSDGKIAVVEYKNNVWTERFFQNDTLGCNAVSWAPYHTVASHSSEHNGALIYRLVTGSCDNAVRVWRWIEGSPENAWVEEPKTASTPHSG
ncbi:hypothetical protein EON64_06000 [archaeon]|nr:MAG: hypothetical protein EON64_06000 [archaeon]